MYSHTYVDRELFLLHYCVKLSLRSAAAEWARTVGLRNRAQATKYIHIQCVRRAAA